MLSDYLKLSLSLNDDIVVLSPLNNTVISTPANKLIVSLVNMERETAGGLNYTSHAVSESHFNKNLPGWQMNLYVLFAAVFNEKQYEESLRILSATMYFLQLNKNYTVAGINTPFAIEPVNLSLSELSNLWSTCGNTYFPSVLCKIRLITIDSSGIGKLSRPVISKETTNE